MCDKRRAGRQTDTGLVIDRRLPKRVKSFFTDGVSSSPFIHNISKIMGCHIPDTFVLLLVICPPVAGQPEVSRGGAIQTPLHLRAGKHHLQRRAARRMVAFQTNSHGEGQGEAVGIGQEVFSALGAPVVSFPSVLCRKLAAVCVRGRECFRCSAPIRSSSTRTRGRPCSGGPPSVAAAKTSSQSASGAAWWTSPTARPNGSTRCG